MAPALAALDLALGQLQHVVCRLANGAKDRAAPDWEGLGELHGEVRTRQRHAVYLGLPARNRVIWTLPMTALEELPTIFTIAW